MPRRALLALTGLAISGILIDTMFLVIAHAVLCVLLLVVVMVVGLAMFSKLKFRQLIRICNLIQVNGEIAGHLRVVEALVSRVWSMHLHVVVMQV
jgi:hypothetical protein